MAGDSQPISQNEIEELLRQNAATQSPPPAAPASESVATSTPTAKPHDVSAPAAPHVSPSRSTGDTSSPIAQADIELLLSHAERALASVQEPAASELPPGIDPFRLEDFSGAPPSTEVATIELIRDVELDLKIELGRTHMHLEDVLKLKRGSVVALDKMAGDPVDVYVNGRLIARGEVLVLNENFCVRVAELISSETAAAG